MSITLLEMTGPTSHWKVQKAKNLDTSQKNHTSNMDQKVKWYFQINSGIYNKCYFCICFEFSCYHAIGNLVDTFSNSNHSWGSILQIHNHRFPILTPIKNYELTNIIINKSKISFGTYFPAIGRTLIERRNLYFLLSLSTFCWSWSLFCLFFDLDQIFATLVANVADTRSGMGEAG